MTAILGQLKEKETEVTVNQMTKNATATANAVRAGSQQRSGSQDRKAGKTCF